MLVKNGGPILVKTDKEGVRGRLLLTQHFNRRTERAKRMALRAHATAGEQRLWQHLRSKQLGGTFRRQYSVDAYVLDFYAPRPKLAVEVDGDSHFRPAATVYDEERTRHLNRFGIEVVRFTNAEIAEHIEAVLAAIGEALKRRPTTSPSPPPSKGGGNSFGPRNTSP
jgi:very-short-patch-repair endonuclease